MGEKEVISRLKEGDKSAFELLYKRYWKKVYNFTALYITSALDIEEVVQEVFVKLWEARASVNEEKNFEGFLFIITRNIVFDHSRKAFNESFYKMTLLESVEQSHSVEDELAASDLKEYIDYLYAMLTPRQQEVFKLSRGEQLSYREIAELLRISEKTVEHHISDVLKFMRKNLQLYTLFASL